MLGGRRVLNLAGFKFRFVIGSFVGEIQGAYFLNRFEEFIILIQFFLYRKSDLLQVILVLEVILKVFGVVGDGEEIEGVNMKDSMELRRRKEKGK